MEHNDIPAGELHSPFQWVVADASARTSLTPDATEVYKTCLQLSDSTEWVLLSVAPITWGASYTHPATHPASMISEDATHRFATDAEKSVWNAKLGTGAIGSTVAPLVNGLVPAVNLPSYVDDVVEAANLAAFPATGETGKIYVALDTNKTYRWSGSAYVEISASPGSTDAVTEGTSNLYFTFQRVRDTLLTGLSTATRAAVVASDTILTAVGKLQANVGLATTVLANLTFSGYAARILGDFSNAIVANRTLFQTSTANSATTVSAVPSGTEVTSVFSALNSSDPTNASNMSLFCTTNEASLRASRFGTGSYLPMTFFTSGAERVCIGIDGATTFGGLIKAAGDIALITGVNQYMYYEGALHISNSVIGDVLVMDDAGRILATKPAGLGYGPGAGGTVTQSTSKSTAVTLNKPCGQITTSNAALAAGASVTFQVTNSLVTLNDGIDVAVSGSTNYTAVLQSTASGSFYIRLTNTTAGSLSEAVVITFRMHRGSAS